MQEKMQARTKDGNQDKELKIKEILAVEILNLKTCFQLKNKKWETMNTESLVA